MTSPCRRILTFVLLAIAPAAFADGIIMPPVVVSRLPDMPMQRALIVYRGGIEKLIVQSPFKGEGNELAWLLPVPAEPTDIGKASAGLFTTLEIGLQPDVIDEKTGWHPIGLLLIVWSLLIFVSGRFVPVRAFLVAIAITFVFAVGSLSMRARTAGTQSLDGNASTAVAGVKATDIRRVGSYDVQTLQADSSADLNQWLSLNGYRSFPETAVPIVDDYIAQKWKFVVARLHREQDGFSRPHPLAVTFAADSPVYPMRLTQLAGSDLRLDLFVIADRQIAVKNMTTIYSDRFRLDSRDYIRSLCGKKFKKYLCLPLLVDIAGGDCVITWLQADLANAQLNSDFALVDAPEAPTRQTVYTARAVAMTAQSNMTLALGIVLALGAVLYAPCKTRRARAIALLATVAVALICSATVNYATHSRIPYVDTLEPEKEPTTDKLIKILNAYPETLAKMSRDDVELYFRDALKDYRNPYTGEFLAFEEAPGDLVIAADNYGLFVRTFTGPFGMVGAPLETRITGQPSPNPPGHRPANL